MSIINLCPHPMVLNTVDGAFVYLETPATAARVQMTPGPLVTEVDGIPIHQAPLVLGITNLPEFDPRRTLIVSRLTALVAATIAPDRTDLVYPGTDNADWPMRFGAPVPGLRGQKTAVTRLIKGY